MTMDQCFRTSVTTVSKLQDQSGGSLKNECSYFTPNQQKNKTFCRKKMRFSFNYKHHFIYAKHFFFDPDHLHLLKPSIITPQTSSVIKSILVLHETCFKKHNVTLRERTETNTNVTKSTINGSFSFYKRRSACFSAVTA